MAAEGVNAGCRCVTVAGQAMDAAIECLPDVQGIVRRLTPLHYTPLLPMTGRYVLYDAEWRKAIRFPNSVFVPHSRLPSPELSKCGSRTQPSCDPSPMG